MEHKIPGSLKMLEQLTTKIDSYLHESSNNLVVLHCETGFEKSGFICICLLLSIGLYTNNTEAISFFAEQRMIQPSFFYEYMSADFIRYIHYFECTLRCTGLDTYTYQLDAIRFNTIPNCSSSVADASCSPHVNIDEIFLDVKTGQHAYRSVFQQQQQTSSGDIKTYDSSSKYAVLDLKKYQINVSGDVVLSFYSGDVCICELCVNTTFIENNYLVFEKSVIEASRKDYECLTFHRDFVVEVFLHKVRNKDLKGIR